MKISVFIIVGVLVVVCVLNWERIRSMFATVGEKKPGLPDPAEPKTVPDVIANLEAERAKIGDIGLPKLS